MILLLKVGFLSLDRTQRFKYIFFTIMGAGLAVLELIGVGLSALIGVLLMSEFLEIEVPILVSKVLGSLKIVNGDEFSRLFFLVFISLILLILKSLLSLLLSRRLFRFLTQIESNEIESISKKIFNSQYEKVSKYQTYEIADTLTRGLSAAISNLLGQWQIVLSEIFLVLLIFSTLLYLNPIFSTMVALYFMVVIYGINKHLHSKVDSTNRYLTKLRVTSVETITNFLKLYREFKVYRRIDFATKGISRVTTSFSDQYARDMWMQMIPKYALELAVLSGVFVILVIGNLFQDTNELILIIFLFFAAGARLLPSIMRIQAAMYTLKGHEHLAKGFFEMRNFFSYHEIKTVSLTENSQKSAEMIKEILFSKVVYTYADGNFSCELDFSVPLGNKIAIVGSSGAGKSTLADLIMGIVQPDSGEILIADISLTEWLANSDSRIAYVPQETILIDGDVFDNIAIGVSRNLIDFDFAKELLADLGLNHLIHRDKSGINADVSDLSLSGGERQRIGIARALYSRPIFIVMDESTSSLDADSEQIALDALNRLDNSVTLLVIAHRLSSIRDFDTLIYLESGQVSGIGTFDSLRSSIKQFDYQAGLLGL
jgi:ABC-type multidrug transport system fused ATPase/permease subunit